jgi:hypothetical protein
VVKIIPSPGPLAPEDHSRGWAGELRGFLGFVTARSPWLLALTLLMLLPWVGSALTSAARCFIPYQ